MATGWQTLLILAFFAVITVLLFRPFNEQDCGDKKKEHYDNRGNRHSGNSNLINPSNHPHSRDISFRPHTTDDQPADNNIFDVGHGGRQFQDHIDAQNRVRARRAVMDKMLDRDDSNDRLNYRQIYNSNPNRRMDPAVRKRVRFATGNPTAHLDDMPIETNMDIETIDDINNARGANIRDVDIDTSMDKAKIVRNRVLESNNIARYCVHPKEIDQDNDVYTNMIERALLEDIDDDTFYDMLNPHMKTYIELDPTTSRLTETYRKTDSNINNLEDLEDTIDKYRDNTIKTIIGSNDRNRNYPKGKPMYNRVHE